MSAQAETTQTTAVHINTIGQIALTVTDLAAAKRFYQDILGMTFLFDAGKMCFFQCGSIRLMIGLTEKPASEPTTPQGSGTILYFRVVEIQSVYTALKQEGAEFIDEPHLIA